VYRVRRDSPAQATARKISSLWSAAQRSSPSAVASGSETGRALGARTIASTDGALAEAVKPAQPCSKRYIVPAGAGASAASRVTAPRSTSANTAGLEPISSISFATGVGSPGTTSLA